MRKIITILIMSLIMIGLSGCGGGGSEPTPNPVEKTVKEIAIEKVSQYATTNGASTAPTIQDYVDIGVNGVNTENISGLNQYIATLSKEDVDTTEEIKVIRQTVDAIIEPEPINQNPTVSLTVSGTLKVGHDVTVSVNANDSDGSIASYVLSGDITGNSNTATKTFTSAGIKTVTVLVTDNDGATATTSKTFTVTVNEPINQNPTVSLTVSGTLKVGHDVTVSVNANDSDGSIASYVLSGDITGNSNTATKTFTSAGIKTVTVLVTDNDGATATTSKTFTIMANQAPTATIDINGTLKVGHDVTVSVNANDSDGSVVSTVLSGAFDNANTTKTFISGDYSVTAVVTDNEGAQTTVVKNFTIVDLTNQEKVDAFEAGKTLIEIVTGVKLEPGELRHSDGQSANMFGGDEQAFFNGNEMVKGDAPCEYNFEPGLRGTIVEDTGLVSHWDYFHIDYSYENGGDEEIITYLNYCSSGLYDVELWNGAYNPGEWIRYNTMAQFHPDEYAGREYLFWSVSYTENWDSSVSRIEMHPAGGIVYMVGENGYHNDSVVSEHKIEKTFLDTYSVKEGNHLGLIEGTVLNNCISSKNSIKSNDGENRDKGMVVESVICENYGILELNHYLVDNEIIQ